MKNQKIFLFDQDFCIGCKSCEIACQVKHEHDMSVIWRKVTTREHREKIGVVERYMTATCNHCEKPACLEVCPAEAITKRAKDGIVLIDDKKCIGCGYCAMECTYDVIVFQNKKATKCDMCVDLQEKGELPACVEACPMDVLKLSNLAFAKKAHFKEEAIGFRHNSFKPTTRFYPTFKSGMVRVDI